MDTATVAMRREPSLDGAALIARLLPGAKQRKEVTLMLKIYRLLVLQAQGRQALAREARDARLVREMLEAMPLR
jgi:hypothetical protein